MLPSRNWACNSFFPVGLILSPTTRKPSPISKERDWRSEARWYLVEGHRSATTFTSLP